MVIRSVTSANRTRKSLLPSRSAVGHSHAHSHSDPEINPRSARYREVKKVTLIGSLIDLVLGVAKIFVGMIAHSQALIADGIHSLSDLVTDFMVLWAAKHAHSEADEEHPYGHGRIETVATIGLGLALIGVAVGIAYDAVQRLFNPDALLQPGYLALVVAGASILSKEAIYHYTMWAAKKHRSAMLRANAWHSRTDAISSVVVFVGVVGTMYGLTYLDAVAAVLVAVMIAKIAWDLIWQSVQEIMDAGLEEERVHAIREAILEVDGVRELHELRTRRLGPDALVDVHVLVGPRLSISEGHHIAEAVRSRLIQRIDEVSDVMVHIDPEDDEQVAPCRKLPLRSEVTSELEAAWTDLPGVQAIQDMTLHYLDGKVEVDLVLPLDLLQQHEASEIRSGFEEVAAKLEILRCIRVSFG
ncbi:MAG: cation transporter [Gammaproteobacteria bacterium]|nr:cation transporter [Gammaproteobacteria bacterium]